MTDPLYLPDSSVREFTAPVERSLDDRVVLDRTHLYPEGGGQPADLQHSENRLTDLVEVGLEDDPYDRTACAGTHVETTRELGRAVVTGRETKGSDEERLTLELRGD